MPNIDDIEDVIIGVAGYNFYQRLVAKHGQINVLFYGALFLTIAVALFAWGLHSFVNLDLGDTWNKSKKNDKLYVDDYYFGSTNSSFELYQLALPITNQDIDTMKIPAWEKKKWKYGVDTTMKPRLILGAVVFDVDSMYKYNTSLCGTLVNKDSTTEESEIEKWYIVKPNFKVGRKVDMRDSVPAGYLLHDVYYIEPNWVRLQEAQPFINQSKKH